MSLCAVGRTVLGHLVLQYSPEVAYYTTLQDVPSPPADSRCCRSYWVTQAIPDAPRLYVRARQDCCHRGSRITSARRSDTFENYAPWWNYIRSYVTSPSNWCKFTASLKPSIVTSRATIILEPYYLHSFSWIHYPRIPLFFPTIPFAYNDFRLLDPKPRSNTELYRTHS
jgi:hypothetical protein